MPNARSEASGSSRHALFTDLYELTMLQAYVAEGADELAVFDLSVRSLPPQRNFLIAAGLEECVRYLETLAFEDEAIAYLDTLGLFDRAFLDWLAAFHFEGTLRALPEGTMAFAGEPLLEVIAPLPQAQLVETFLLNQVTFQTLVASKAARSVIAAQGRPVVDFGARRTHGLDAGELAARACYLAGFAATSNVAAGARFGLPVTGTMAHAYIQAHDSEAEAFRAFVARYPETTLLVDTYDTEQGVREVVRLAEELGDAFRVRAVRLDSGDLDALSRSTRTILDAAGLQRVGIVASGGLDEASIEALVAAGAPISAFAVGTRVGTSSDAPTLDSTYKLVEYARRGRLKLSPDKRTLPGRKQLFRRTHDGVLAGDTLAREGERIEGEPLLVEVMRGGARVPGIDFSLETARERAARGLAALPVELRALAPAGTPYHLDISQALRDEAARISEQLRPNASN